VNIISLARGKGEESGVGEGESERKREWKKYVTK